MNKKFFIYILSLFVLFLFLIPAISSFFLNLEQKRADKLLLEQGRIFEKIKKDKQDKIYLTGKFDPSQRNDFSPVPAELNIGGYKMYLRKETLDAFLKMEEAAEKDNVDLKIASATRNFDYQKKLWNDKWTGVKIVDGKSLLKSIPDELERFKKILEYSAVPGASRHHWGTDFDINDATPEYFETEKGEKVYDWLVENAPSFGFCQPYNVKESERATGYNEEKWHWSYAPLSKNFTEEYRNLIKNADIKGFDGDEYVPSFDLINDYVLAINPDCL